MSLTSSKSTIRTHWTTFYVLYSYESGGELHSGVRSSLQAKNEEEAILEARQNLLVSTKKSFTAHVIGSRQW